jgi:hypothetical protein
LTHTTAAKAADRAKPIRILSKSSPRIVPSQVAAEPPGARRSRRFARAFRIEDAMPMTTEDFRALVKPVTDFLAGRALDDALEADLNRAFPGDGAVFRVIESACHAGIGAGWMCTQGGGNRRFGRIFEPDEDLSRYSVDVVDISDLVGNHHRHPTG